MRVQGRAAVARSAAAVAGGSAYMYIYLPRWQHPPEEMFCNSNPSMVGVRRERGKGKEKKKEKEKRRG